MVYDLTKNELEIILEAVKQSKIGSKQSLRKRVLNLLAASSTKTRVLRQKIIQVYKSRSQTQPHQQQTTFQSPSTQTSQLNGQQQPNFLQRVLRQPSSYTANSVQPINEISSTEDTQFVDLPFFQMITTLLMPMHCQTNVDAANFTGLFYLTDSIRHSIVKSWNIARQEYKIQIILRLVQVGLKENVTERLPYNITVSVNDRQCKLPTLNIPTKAGITPWRCNVPIDITLQTDLRNCLQNTLKITWSEEPHEYMAGVFVAQKLTWSELLVELKKRPLRKSEKTRALIKRSMASDGDMGVDSMFATIKDPLSKKRMELPARGSDCIHLHCFDAIQFLQMNEQKQTWLCPLCKKKVGFENIEVDEFFLSIVQNSDLSEDCESVILLEDGTWTEKKNKEFSNNLDSNDNSNQIEVFTLSDSSDEEDMPKAKRLKFSPPKAVESVIKSEHTMETEDQMKINTNSTENDVVLDLSLKNSSSPTTSSECQPIILLNDDDVDQDSHHHPHPRVESSGVLLNNYYFPGISITDNNNKDCKPSSSGNSRSKNQQEKDSSRNVICVITLD